MQKKYKILGAAALAAVLALGAVYALWDTRSAEPGVRLGRVERGPIIAVVSATGTVNPVISVQVGSQVSGQIKELYVDFNSEVKKNQVIARIDPEPFELKVKQASADLEATRTTVLTQRATVGAMRADAMRQRINADDAGRDYERKKTLYEKEFVSIADRDKAQATYDAAREAQKTAEAQVKVGEAQVENAEAVVRQREAAQASAKVDLEHTYIRAPVDGVVISRNVDAGQTVAASLQAPVLFMIAQNLQDMEVDTSIDEADVGRIRLGQPVSFTVDSFPGRTFNGKVSQVRKAAQVVQNVVTYTVVVATANPDLTLLPGMTANVRIVTDTRDSVLKLPNAALRYRPAGAEPRDAAAPAPEAPPRDPAAAKAASDQLVKELGLDAAQQAKLDAILADVRKKNAALEKVPEADRRKQAETIRVETRARIADLLNADQKRKYEQLQAARSANTGRVYVLDEGGQPRPLSVRLGLTDGTSTELVGSTLVGSALVGSAPVGSDLAEGAQVIIAAAPAGKNVSAPAGGPRPGF